MNKHSFAFLWMLIIGISAFGQSLPVINANSKTVDILDGHDFQKGSWQISPEVKPDVFYASRFRQPKKIAFYTDVDSISFIVEPDKEYKFIILLNGKDSAYTTISTFSKSALNFRKKNGSSVYNADTIPFTLGRGDKIYIKGKINSSVELTFMFDTGSDQEVISASGLSKKVKLNFDDVKNSITIGGMSTIPNSKSNRLKIGNLVWDDVPIAQINEADADGIIGYNVFDNKIVEINYDKNILIVHTQPIKVNDSYEKLPMLFKGNLPFIEAALLNGDNAIKEYFEFDTGSNGSLWLNKDFAKENGLYGTMKTIGETSSKGLDGKRIYNGKVVLPTFAFGKYSLANVPIDLELASESNNFKWGILGMDILKRYNTILDFQDDNVYLKPNSLLAMPFHKPFDKNIMLMGLALTMLMFIGGIVTYRRQKAKQKNNFLQREGAKDSHLHEANP